MRFYSPKPQRVCVTNHPETKWLKIIIVIYYLSLFTWVKNSGVAQLDVCITVSCGVVVRCLLGLESSEVLMGAGQSAMQVAHSNSEQAHAVQIVPLHEGLPQDCLRVFTV